VSKIEATSGLVSALADAWTICGHGVSFMLSVTPIAARFDWKRSPTCRPISFPVGNHQSNVSCPGRIPAAASSRLACSTSCRYGCTLSLWP
jgi:hypothetical protein